jgi:hypothetical protein
MISYSNDRDRILLRRQWIKDVDRETLQSLQTVYL